MRDQICLDKDRIAVDYKVYNDIVSLEHDNN